MKKKCMLAVGMLLVLSMLSGCGAKKDGPMDQVQEIRVRNFPLCCRLNKAHLKQEKTP